MTVARHVLGNRVNRAPTVVRSTIRRITRVRDTVSYRISER